jgi:RNA polymerase sigma-70 factor (ECF subfamily)
LRLDAIETSAQSPDGLLRRARSGDERARQQLYDEHFPHVYAYLLEVLKHHDDAEDACQHVFLRMFVALPSYELDGEPFTAWLFTLVRNHAIDRLRSATRAKTTATDPSELNRTAETHAAARAALQSPELDAAVEALPQLQRQTISLIYEHDLYATEAAAILGRSPAAVRQLHRRALATLALALAS